MAEDYRACYDSEDSLQNKLRKAVAKAVNPRAFRIINEFKIHLWMEVYGKENFIELRYAIGAGKGKVDSNLLNRIEIFRDDDGNQLLTLHAARRLGLDMDDQIVAVTVPRLCDIVMEFLDDFVSFRDKEPQHATRNV